VERASLKNHFVNKTSLTVYLPAFLSTNKNGTRCAELILQNGSGDFMGAVGANGFAEIFPEQVVKENDVVSFYTF
jgi:molybdopterin biosynthesis enzyme